MFSLNFKCCKHGTCPKDCPICQRILLVWTIEQILPNFPAELVYHIASFIKERQFIKLCGICLITKGTDWRTVGVDGVLSICKISREVYIQAGSKSKYFGGISNSRLYLSNDEKHVTYEEFCSLHPSYDFFLWGDFWKTGYEIICMYKSKTLHSPDICDICIDRMLERGNLEDVIDLDDNSSSEND